MADRLQRMFAGMAGGNPAGPPADMPQVDTSEQIYISSLALLKMLKHGACVQQLESLLKKQHAVAAGGSSAPRRHDVRPHALHTLAQVVRACPWR